MTASASPEKTGQKRKVFLVDDHPLVREWLTNLINQQPDLAVCGEAESRPEAIGSISNLKPDVAIVDIALKGSSGLELIKDITELCPATAVLVLSMHDESHYAERALRAGARGYIMKRETTRNVIAALRRVMAGQLHISQSIATAMAGRLVGARTGGEVSPLEQLSDRELEVFQLLGQGRGTRQISETLGLSLKTVQAYCARIKEKLNLNGASELLREALRWNDRGRQA
jgi:DNA-binding NarL/FixJ family response regulator